jgi:outer membrane receptor protein involved in Fe transport
MEARVPIAQDQAFAESLSFDTAYRYSDYGGETTDTYKLGLDGLRCPTCACAAATSVPFVRPTSWNSSRRRASTCSTRRAIPAARRRATRRERRGVHRDRRAGQPGRFAALDSPAGQYQFLQGGNVNLTPESSDTYSYGVVFQPRWVPGLAITVDYFDISIDDTITTFQGPNTWTRATPTTIRRPAPVSTATRMASSGSAMALCRTSI